MKVQTSRFGELEVKKNDILSFPEGILGFENLKKFFIADPGDKTLILWLQSMDSPNIAFPIIEPKIFKPDYSIKLLPAELLSLQLENLNDAKIFSILTIPEDITLMSANLKAPIITNCKNNLSRQIVLQDNKLPVRFEMYKMLKTYISNYISDDRKRTTVVLSHNDEYLDNQHNPKEEVNKILGEEEYTPRNEHIAPLN